MDVVFLLLLGAITYITYKLLQPKTIVELHEYPIVDARQFEVIFTRTTRRHISKKRRQQIQIIIKVPVNLPNFFLDSLYKDKLIYASEFAYYNQDQRLSLEGDFNTYFQLYAPKKFEVEVLQVLSPDVMRILVDQIPKTDMYVINRTIRLSTHVAIDPQTVINDITPLMQKIARLSKIWDIDNKIAFSKYFLLSQPDVEALKFGRRLFNTQTIANWLMFFTPIILWSVLLYAIHSDGTNDTILTTKFVFFSYVIAFAMGAFGAMLLYLNDKGIIDLHKD